MKCIKLSMGNIEMPIVGLGTWRAQPEEIQKAVSEALDCGYRHIDTAFNYNTEEPIGNALQAWMESGKGTRDDVFVTTKLPNVGNRPQDVERFLKMSLQKLQLDYVDLYLIHMPFSFHCNETNFSPVINEDGLSSAFCQTNLIPRPASEEDNPPYSVDRSEQMVDIMKNVFKMMEQQVKNGLTKAIGLSNFNVEQIQRIYNAADIKPAVVQVEMHAYLQQKDLRATCKRLNIAVTAYSPLGSPGANTHFNNKYNYAINNFPDILGHPVVEEIAVKYNKTPGQILLKHLIQADIIVIPKSGNPDRIKANIDLFDFELSENDLEKLNSLDRGEQGRIFDFKFFKGVENHSEYPFKSGE